MVRVDHEQYVTSDDFDDYGRVTRVYYPDGFAVANIYDDKGYFIKVSNEETSENYWSASAIDVLGRITEESYGNGVNTIKQYNESDERIKNIQSKDSNGKRTSDLTLGTTGSEI